MSLFLNYLFNSYKHFDHTNKGVHHNLKDKG